MPGMSPSTTPSHFTLGLRFSKDINMKKLSLILLFTINSISLCADAELSPKRQEALKVSLNEFYDNYNELPLDMLYEKVHNTDTLVIPLISNDLKNKALENLVAIGALKADHTISKEYLLFFKEILSTAMDYDYSFHAHVKPWRHRKGPQ